MMNDLDQEIRHRLEVLIDKTPMPRSFNAATAGNRLKPIPTSARFGPVIGIAAVGVLAAIVAVMFWPTAEAEQIVASPGEIAVMPDVLENLEFGGSAITGLPGADREQRLLAVLGDDLVLGSSSGPFGGAVVEVAVMRDEDRSSAETLLIADVAGPVVAMETIGDRIVVVTTGHIVDEAPTVFVSNDAGGNWERSALPVPPGASQAQLGVAGGAAISGDTIAIAGFQGVWTNSGSGWVYSEVVTEGQLSSIIWDGIGFVLTGGIPDPDDDRNAIPTVWRSPDAADWTPQTVPPTDRDLRTVDGAGPAVVNDQGAWVSVTPAQRFEDSPAGTYLIAGDTGTDEVQSEWDQDWTFRTAVPTPWGFLASATTYSAPNQPVFIGSTDGTNWFDLNEAAPGNFDTGVFWDDSYIVAGNDSITGERVVWVIPTDEDVELTYVAPSSDLEAAPASSFPDWFDVTTATPILPAAGVTELEAIGAYFATLNPDPTLPTFVQSTSPPLGFVEVFEDFRAELSNELVSYRWRDGSGQVNGTVYLRQRADTWDVVAIETQGLAVEALAIDDGILTATITNGFDDQSYADVLDADGQPVPASPNLDGYVSRGAETPYGTAAGEGGSRLEFDIEIPDEPVRLRTYLVGGGLFGPTEFFTS